MATFFRRVWGSLRVGGGVGAALVALLFVGNAAMAASCDTYEWCYSGGSVGVSGELCRGSASGVASAFADAQSGKSCTWQGNPASTVWTLRNPADVYGDGTWMQYEVWQSCGGQEPANNGQLASIQRRTKAGDCDDNCDAKAGQTSTVNWTLGYTRVADTNKLSPTAMAKAFVGPVKWPSTGSPTKLCDKGCKVAVTNEIDNFTRLWQSKTPTTGGLYRVSVDYASTNLGESCTADEAAVPAPASPTAPQPPCDGSRGTVNGKDVCVAVDPPAQAASDVAPVTGAENTVSGNPTAGNSDLGGTSGRVPVSGDGGPAGGPAGSGTGSATGAPGSGTANLPGNTATDDPESENPTATDDCEKNAAAAGCGGKPASVGELYTAKDATFQTALEAFRVSMAGSPVGSAMTGFFTVSAPAGGCPTASGSVPLFGTSWNVNIDAYCSPMANSMFLLLRGVLLVVAGFAAFKVAFGD